MLHRSPVRKLILLVLIDYGLFAAGLTLAESLLPPVKPPVEKAADGLLPEAVAGTDGTSEESGDRAALLTGDVQLPDVTGTDDLKPPSPMAQASVEPVDQQKEFFRLRALLAQNSFSRNQQEIISPIIPEVPQVATPLEEITALTLPLTAWNSKIVLHPHLSFTGVFDDNINLSSSNKESDFIFAVSPGVGLMLGDEQSPLLIVGDYTPSFLLFANHDSQNTFDQTGMADIRYVFTKLTLGLHLTGESVTGGSTDVGDRVRRTVGYAGLRANYVMNEKFSFDADIEGSGANYNGLLGSTEARIRGWLNYQATGKISLGVGSTFGTLDVQGGSTQTYEEALARVSYDATGKLVLNASGGVDIRQADSSSVNPVFGIGVVYAPFATTTITMDIYERIYGSAALVRENYTSTGITTGIRQQLQQNLFMAITTGYVWSNYYAVAQNVNATRVDNVYFVRVGPEWQITRWCNSALFYEFSDDSSSGNGSRSFSRNRVGVQANFAF